MEPRNFAAHPKCEKARRNLDERTQAADGHMRTDTITVVDMIASATIGSTAGLLRVRVTRPEPTRPVRV